MISEVETAIKTKLLSVEGDTFIGAAPENVKDPYLLITIPTSSNDYDSVKTYPNSVIQVAGYSRNRSTAQSLAVSVKSTLDRKQSTFSLTSYYIVNISCSFETEGILEGVYFFIHQYKFDIEPK